MYSINLRDSNNFIIFKSKTKKLSFCFLTTVKVNSPVNESSVAPLAPEDKNAAVNEQLENIKNEIKARFDKF